MESNKNTPLTKFFLFFSSFLFLVGACSGVLITRLYFIHGGNRIWLSSWIQTCFFPIILIPLSISYMYRRKTEGSNNAKLVLMKPSLLVYAAITGLIYGVINYLFGYGSSKLPVSTVTIIYAAQLAFTAAFAFLLVKQRFTPYLINSIILLTLGAATLALNASMDLPEGESKKEYILGFMLMALSVVVNGLMLPLIELAYMKANQTVTYTLAMEFDFVMCLFATAFSLVGMLVNNDFQAIGREAREYDLGHVTYYIVLASDAIAWQCSVLGLNGVIFCASSLFSGILFAVTIPINEVLSVIFFHEKFQAQKGVSLVLAIWGFISYFYGEISKPNQSSQVGTLQVKNLDESLEEEQTLTIHH